MKTILLLASLVFLHAASAATLSGVVSDHAKPVAGAIVRITSGGVRGLDGSPQTGVARTGDDGAFSLSHVAPGQYAVDVEWDGGLVYRDLVMVGPVDAQKMKVMLDLDRGSSAVATVTIVDADDDSRIELSGTVVSIWSRDHGRPVSFKLRDGRQRLSVYVFNQASYTGGLALFGGHQPEGWRYKAYVDLPGMERISLTGKEHRPAADGGRLGREFPVATIDLEVGKDGSVKVVGAEKDWRRFTP